MSEEHLVSLPAHPTSSSARSALSSLPIALTPAARAGGAAPTWRLDLPRSAQPGTSPFPKLLALKFQRGMEMVSGGHFSIVPSSS